jgi:hypothetical protein
VRDALIKAELLTVLPIVHSEADPRRRDKGLAPAANQAGDCHGYPISPYAGSSVVPVILASTAGFVVLAVFIGLALEKPAIIVEMPGATKAVLVPFIFALTICVSILSWYFSSMTVDVTGDELRWRFAGGQGYTIARAEIDRVRTVPHRWWVGYGIKYFGPSRWTYVIGGWDAVEVSLKRGGWRRLGTGAVVIRQPFSLYTITSRVPGEPSH